MTHEQTLLEKKQHAEDLLKTRLKDREWYVVNESPNRLIRRDGHFHTNVEDTDLEIEILQDFIENTDKYLKEKTLKKE